MIFNQELSISIKFLFKFIVFFSFSIMFCSFFCYLFVHLHQQKTIVIMLLYILLLPLSLVVHEIGHVLMALLFRVRVSKFCIFFDPWFRLLDTGKRFKTRFCIGWIPLGAYVRFGSSDGDDSNRSVLPPDLHPLKRVMISISGALMNLLMTYICIFAWVGSHEYNEGELSIMQQIASTNYIVESEAKSTFSSISGYWMPQINNTRKPIEQSVKTVTAKKKATSNRWRTFLWGFACLNLFLAIFNMLPIPPLDGAQTLYNIYEFVLHRPVSRGFQIIAGAIGILLILGANVADFIRYVCNML